MFLFTYMLCVKYNVLYNWGTNVQVLGGPNHLAPALYVPQSRRLRSQQHHCPNHLFRIRAVMSLRPQSSRPRPG